MRRVLSTPLGPMTARVDGESVTALSFGVSGDPEPGTPGEAALLERLEQQLVEYAAGGRRVFDLPLNPAGTPFQRQVWRALLSIPWGERRSYGEIAAAMGKPGAARAVGLACGRNPIAVVIPCHRVVGRSGALTGYSAPGGTELKQRLLTLEQSHKESL